MTPNGPTPLLTQRELLSIQPVFLCRFNNCNTFHPVDHEILTQHLAAAHGYEYTRKTRQDCLWAGCLCSSQARRLDCQPHPHPAHVENLVEHIWERHLLFRYVCPRCERADWVDRSSLDRHLQRCAGQTPVRCPRCFFAFPNEQSLIAHDALCRTRAGSSSN
jgi:hypothetical protein